MTPDRPRYFRSNEPVQDAMERLQAAIKEQHGFDEIVGSCNMIVTKKDGKISIMIVNHLPKEVFACPINIASIQSNFANWLYELTLAAHEEGGFE